MRITKYFHLWQMICWEAAKNAESFYLEHLTPEHATFLEALAKNFRRPFIWSRDRTAFHFNPPPTQKAPAS